MDSAAAEAQGTPRMVAVTRGKLRLAPVPDGAGMLVVVYRAVIPALTEAAPSNWLLVKHPDAYFYGALVALAAQLRDAEGVAYYEGLYQRVMDSIMAEERERHAASGAMIIRAEGRV